MNLELHIAVVLTVEALGELILLDIEFSKGFHFQFQDNAIVWCIGWQKNQGQGITILGGLCYYPRLIFILLLINFVYPFTTEKERAKEWNI